MGKDNFENNGTGRKESSRFILRAGLFALLAAGIIILFFSSGCCPIASLPGPEAPETEEKSWVWEETGAVPESLSFQMNAEEEKVDVYLSGEYEKSMGDGDSFSILNLNKVISVSVEDGKYIVFLNSGEIGYFVFR